MNRTMVCGAIALAWALGACTKTHVDGRDEMGSMEKMLEGAELGAADVDASARPTTRLEGPREAEGGEGR